MRGVSDIPETLAPVQQVLVEALLEVERVFDRELASELPPVEQLCRHIERYRGKMLRPSLVILSGLVAHPDAGATHPDDLASLITERHHMAGAVCEMIHMATLVHDDVLDEADMRRRGETVNRLRGNETAVMLGDYLIASSYHLCALIRDHRTSEALAATSQRLCTGELLQLHHRDDLSLDEPTYFEIIDRKTAVLIAESCRLGAHHGGASDGAREALGEFGRLMGLAFQIRDDLLDLTGDEAVVGKSIGKDLEKGKLTLPMIRHLREVSATERAETIRLAQRAETPDAGGDTAACELAQRLRESGAVRHAEATVADLIDRGLGQLHTLPDSAARAFLMHIARATAERAF